MTDGSVAHTVQPHGGPGDLRPPVTCRDPSQPTRHGWHCSVTAAGSEDQHPSPASPSEEKAGLKIRRHLPQSHRPTIASLTDVHQARTETQHAGRPPSVSAETGSSYSFPAATPAPPLRRRPGLFPRLGLARRVAASGGGGCGGGGDPSPLSVPAVKTPIPCPGRHTAWEPPLIIPSRAPGRLPCPRRLPLQRGRHTRRGPGRISPTSDKQNRLDGLNPTGRRCYSTPAKQRRELRRK